MESESKIGPVLGHLAWLAENIPSSVNNGRSYDAAILTYNAAAMLQWRFLFPVCELDTSRDEEVRSEVAELIDALVETSRKTVVSARHHPEKDEVLRKRLAKAGRKVVAGIPKLLLVGIPLPALMPELESSPDISELMDEFLEAHHYAFGLAIAKGKASGAKGGVGPERALSEAVAALIYTHDAEKKASMPLKTRRGLAQIAAGFFKTAVDIQPNDDVPTPKMRRIRKLAQSLVEQAVEGGGA